MVVAVFRSRIRSDASTEEIAELGQKMYELVSAMPGFLSYKDFIAEDGENVSIIEFETHEALDAWREHPDHKVAQARGRDAFFAEYHIQVCHPLREYRFTQQEAKPNPLKSTS